MFENLPDGMESLVIQPVVIPRKFDPVDKKLYFYIVFSFARQDKNGTFRPHVRRESDHVEIPECLRLKLPPYKKAGMSGYWPTYITSLLESGDVQAAFFRPGDAAPFYKTPKIELPPPRDLHEYAWDVAQGDALWERLLLPSARATAATALRFRRASSGLRSVSFASAPVVSRADEVDPLDFVDVRPNPWSASDLRPGRRIESIETRTVASDIATFLVNGGAADPSADPLDSFLKMDKGLQPQLLKFVEEREGAGGDLGGLLKALQREDDVLFREEVLPALRRTHLFDEKLRQLTAWRDEFLLTPSRGEILRQSRFVDGARNRSTGASVADAGARVDSGVRRVSGGPASTASPLDFERQVARLRQHPGLMRRLYLTVRCAVAWDPKTPPCVTTLEGGMMGLTGNIDESPFLSLTTKTLFDLRCDSEPYFRPAPAATEASLLRFYGKHHRGEAREHFRRYHALAPDLYQVSQEDPSLAMLRAAQGVTDAAAAQSGGEPRSDGPRVLNDALHRINAVNIYHRAFASDGKDAPFAGQLVDRAKEDLSRLAAFNEHVERYLIASGRKPGPFRTASLREADAIEAAADNAPALFCAENLMMGYSVFVRSRPAPGQASPWRSLNRRMVELTYKGEVHPALRFEEEGFVATSVVAPPRPQTGRVVTADAVKINYDLFGPKNTFVKGSTVNLKDGRKDATPTSFVNGLRPFDLPDDNGLPQQDDVILVALDGSPNKDAPRAADQVFIHPVLRAKVGAKDAFDDVLTADGFRPFTWPVVLDCVNEVPVDDTGTRRTVRDGWRGAIVFAPHFTRLVDYYGQPIAPSYMADEKPPKPTPFIPFRHFTAEVQDRSFARVLGASAAPAVPETGVDPSAYVATNLGPVNQVLLGHVARLKLSSFRVPDVDASASVPSLPVSVMTADRATEGGVREAFNLSDTKLTAVRGWVASVGFLFTLTIQKDEPTDDQKHKFNVVAEGSGAVDPWFATSKLEVSRGGKVEALPAISCPAHLIPKGLKSATVLARCRWTTDAGGSHGIEVTSLEIAAAGSTLNDGGVPLRFTMDLRRIDGGAAEVHYPLGLAVPDAAARRLVHPLDALRQYVEVITPDASAFILASGWPQRPLATLLRLNANDPHSGDLRFPDGSNYPKPVKLDPAFEVKTDAVGPFSPPVSGFFFMTGSDPLPGQSLPGDPRIVDLLAAELLLVGEVVRVGDDQVELCDGSGQTWTIRDEESRGLDLPLGGLDYSVRKVRNLLPGEWLVAACHMDGAGKSPRDVLLARTRSGMAKARAMLRGRLDVPTERPVTRAAEGTTEFRACAYKSLFGRELTVWSDAAATPKEQTITARSERYLLAETLAQYVPPKEDTSAPPAEGAPRGILRRATLSTAKVAASEPVGRPRHLTVSELIARWSNWALGIELPGQADLPKGYSRPEDVPQQAPPYTLAMKRPSLSAGGPSGQPPFDHESWLLPPLRFGRDYQFCVRRVDLAGNHLYEEDSLPADAAPGIPGDPLKQSFWVELESVTRPAAPGTPPAPLPFVRANLPVAPIVAFTPDHLAATLPPPEPGTPALAEATTGYDPGPYTHQFLYLPSPRREALLVLLTDVLSPEIRYEADAVMELLPPPLDVETALLHGILDRRPAAEAAALIRRHERYLDLPPGARALGRLVDGEVNYLPDPAASQVTVTIRSTVTETPAAPAAAMASFYPAQGSSNRTMWPWPHVRWVRLFLRTVARKPYRKGASALPLPTPETTPAADGAAVSIYLPPGATGEATLSVRPECLDPTNPAAASQYDRMARDHGSDTRTVRLVHATNGPWTRPRWERLGELRRDVAAPPSPLRDLEGLLDVDRPTTGSCSVSAGWNDPWDELVPDQHEPAHAVVVMGPDRQASECVLLSGGFGFNQQAIALFDLDGRPFRSPTFQPRFWCGQLHSLVVVDAGVGCDVLFRVVVTSPPTFCRPAPRPAYAQVWHDANGVLQVLYLDRGAGLGPLYHIEVVSERSHLPQFAFTFSGGSVTGVTLTDRGRGPFTRDLKIKIVRRPPFYRVAEARVTAFTAEGGIAGVQVRDPGGWYTLVPHSLAVDPEGDGYGAVLSARLDERGGVIGVDVVCPGRGYSREARVVFYNALADIPEQTIPPPVAADDGAAIPFAFKHPFPDPRARSVDYYAKGLSRFRQYLSPAWSNPGGCDPETAPGRPRDVRRHVPRLSPARKVEILSHVRPDKPDIHYMMPAFAWEVVSPKDEPGVDPVKHFVGRDIGHLVLRRDARIRVYLRRPWNGTGPELLALILPPAILNTTLSSGQPKLLKNDGGAFNPLTTPDAASEPGFDTEPVEGYAVGDDQRSVATRWGFDPAWSEQALPSLGMDHFPAHRPERIYDNATLADGTPSPVTFHRPVWVAAHDVHYDSAKDRWYADVQVNISGGDEYLQAEPIIRLGLARYQPHGLPGRRLSPVVTADPYKMLGRRELEVDRQSTRRFALRLRGEFDRPPENRKHPRREVHARLEARDPALPEEVVHFVPPSTSQGPPVSTTGPCAEHPLPWEPGTKSFARTVEFTPEQWESALRFGGRPSTATLSVVEYEVYQASESRGDAADVEFVVIGGELCARKLIFSSTFQVGPGEVNP